jgi:hypothetical protein
MLLPTIHLGDLKVTRLIVGNNPFSGGSHFSAALDKEMTDYYTVARIKQTLHEAEDAGLNTYLGRADNHIMRMLNEYWNEGGRLQWIAQTAPERKSVDANIDQAIAAGARACFLHGGMVDTLFRAGEIANFGPWLKRIKDKGAVPGIASHNAQHLLKLHEMNLGAEFYMACFYDLYGRGEVYLPEDRAAMSEAIRQVETPCIAYKIMAATRNDPDEAFEYAFAHIKPIDAVCVGIFTKYQPTQVADDAALTLKYAQMAEVAASS